MLLITPTDWGTCADIAGVARVCHDRDLPLIVDDAWGAHLPFQPDPPAWGMDAGAGLVVTSVHKMGATIEQSSVFHLHHDRMNPDIPLRPRRPARDGQFLLAGLPDPGRLAPADGRARQGTCSAPRSSEPVASARPCTPWRASISWTARSSAREWRSTSILMS
jgi:hypothetical protein